MRIIIGVSRLRSLIPPGRSIADGTRAGRQPFFARLRPAATATPLERQSVFEVATVESRGTLSYTLSQNAKLYNQHTPQRALENSSPIDYPQQ